MAELRLRSGHVAILDDEDLPRLSGFTWFARADKRRPHLRTYVVGESKARPLVRITLHRHLLDAPKGLLVDHANGDPLDNRRANLRLATHSDNAQNRLADFTGRRGVYFHAQRKRWVAQIVYERRTIHIGTWDTEEEAKRVRDAVAKVLHGEFAVLNERYDAAKAGAK